jgi:hypothetical protein
MEVWPRILASETATAVCTVQHTGAHLKIRSSPPRSRSALRVNTTSKIAGAALIDVDQQKNHVRYTF